MPIKSKTTDWLRLNATHENQDCLLWPYGRDGGGYARACVSGFSTRLAHRIMCEMVYGEPPTKKHVAMHTCGNGHSGCVNPAHLKWGTVAENNADKERHGTKPIGEKTGLAVLCADSVREIRQLSKCGLSQRKIAPQFGVTAGTIQAVIERRTWRHV